MNKFREKPERTDPGAKHDSEKKSKEQSDSSGKQQFDRNRPRLEGYLYYGQGVCKWDSNCIEGEQVSIKEGKALQIQIRDHHKGKRYGNLQSAPVGFEVGFFHAL